MRGCTSSVGLLNWCVQMLQNSFRTFPRNNPAQALDTRALHIRHATELPQQSLRRQRPDPRDIPKRRFCLPLSTPQAVKRHRKTVRLIANLLNQM
jgi:hypothetical protein